MNWREQLSTAVLVNNCYKENNLSFLRSESLVMSHIMKQAEIEHRQDVVDFVMPHVMSRTRDLFKNLELSRHPIPFDLKSKNNISDLKLTKDVSSL